MSLQASMPLSYGDEHSRLKYLLQKSIQNNLWFLLFSLRLFEKLDTLYHSPYVRYLILN